MSQNCCAVVFSNRAYNAIIRETFEKHPVETGGILLGYIIDDTWVVMEVLPPGKHSIFQTAYFEYDDEFVNYLAHSVANQYKRPLSLLGLWHRHPGNMDVFSGTDDKTNSTFARQLPKGVISGLVNVDPKFRFTMYYLSKNNIVSNARPVYEKVDVEVGDDIIPPSFFELRYVANESSNLHPLPPAGNFGQNQFAQVSGTRQENNEVPKVENRKEELSNKQLAAEVFRRLFRFIKKKWKEVLIVLLVCGLIISLGSSIKSCAHNVREKGEKVMEGWRERRSDKELDNIDNSLINKEGIDTQPRQLSLDKPIAENDSIKNDTVNVQTENFETDGEQGNNNN